MQKTKIEWVKNPDGSQGYTDNPITGCETGCRYCYARSLFDRFGHLWGYDFKPRFHPERIENSFKELARTQNPRGIFLCSMGELFGPWVESNWIHSVLALVKANPRHRFYTLTKWPVSALDYEPFPDNLWFGITVESEEVEWRLIWLPSKVKLRFASFEPLLGPISPRYLDKLDWIIIGAQTGKEAKQPKPEWVQGILDHASCPVFMKNNLKWGDKRREIPQTPRVYSASVKGLVDGR